MPILRLTVAPELQDAVLDRCEMLTERLSEIVTRGLKPAPGTVQLVIQGSLATPIGCPVLLELTHRDTAARTAEIRSAAAEELATALRELLGASARVRLIAVEEAKLAASDVFVEAAAEGERA